VQEQVVWLERSRLGHVLWSPTWTLSVEREQPLVALAGAKRRWGEEEELMDVVEKRDDHFTTIAHMCKCGSESERRRLAGW
jgi:hypothetical protein